AARSDGEWIYCRGFDEALVRERRFPTCGELDVVAPRNPVELRHGSGHAAVLNSSAHDLLGIAPSDGADGVFYEPRFPQGDRRSEIERELACLSRKWAVFGTTYVHDVGASNGPEDHAALRRLAEAGVILQRVGVL